jgi:hypothetical protein
MRKVLFTLGGFCGFITPVTFLFYLYHLPGAKVLDAIALSSLALFFPMLAFYCYKKK